MIRRRPIRREAHAGVIELAGESLSYELKRSSARRTLALRVEEGGAVRVHAPISLPQRHIDAFLRRHADWVRAQRARQASRPGAPQWGDGMELPYLGGYLRLTLDRGEGVEGVERVGQALNCRAAPERIEARVTGWYRAQAADYLERRLAAISLGLGRAPPPWRLSDARTRWGSLSAKGVVGLNWRLIKAEISVIDYVICHELAHFRQRNHSPAFWREVAALCPGYATARHRLREHGRHYLAF